MARASKIREPRRPATIVHEYSLNCMNKRHRILLMSNNKIVLCNHRTREDIEATQVQEMLGYEKCKCLDILRAITADACALDKDLNARLRHEQQKIIDWRRKCGAKTPLRTFAWKADSLRNSRREEKRRRDSLVYASASPLIWNSPGNFLLHNYRLPPRQTPPHRIAGDEKHLYLVARRAAESFMATLVTGEKTDHKGKKWPTHSVDSIRIYCHRDIETCERKIFDKYGGYTMLTEPLAKGDEVHIDLSWYRNVYLRMAGQVSIDGYMILGVEGDGGFLRAITGRNKRPQDGGVLSRWLKLETVKGYVFQKPFGGWGFMPDAEIEKVEAAREHAEIEQKARALGYKGKKLPQSSVETSFIGEFVGY